ncbi:protein kinase family protein [Mycobacterium sp. NPDC050041]|uniref:protein kinase family protein n=1 Tax=Mycobacterium sp. NPDC050041 TaxID=3364293 RepID=UPI003C2C683E
MEIDDMPDDQSVDADDATAAIPALGPVDTVVDNEGPFTAGALIADGRFRLVALQGGHGHLQFWQAFDFAAGRMVALTLVDPQQSLAVDRVNEVLSLTVRQRGLDMPGIAAVREVFHTGTFGVVVSDWVPGGTLRQVADTNPSPLGVAGALQSLAVAAEAAHRAGLVLSIDHPARVRISTDGNAVLAFPGTTPEATPRGDLRGIGGAFYALLVDRWPAQDPMPTGWTAVDADAAGRPQEPAAIDPAIPFLVSAAAAGLVREGGITSAATLMTLLRQARADDAGGGDDSGGAPPPPSVPGGYAGFGNVGPEQQADAAKRQLTRVTLAAAAVTVIVAVVAVVSSLTNVLDTDSDSALDAERLGLNPTTAAPPTSQTMRAAAADAPIDVAEAVVFAPGGSPDNPGDAGKAVDRDPATAWTTDTYRDAVPFPTFKEGLGLSIKLRQPATLSAVTVDLASSGTVIQIRSATTGAPGALADTTELTPPVPVQPGSNRIPVPAGAATSNVVVWISTLGTMDGKSRTEISEVRLIAAAPPA